MSPKQKALFQETVKALIFVGLFIAGVIMYYSSIEMSYVKVDSSSTQEYISAQLEVKVQEPQECVKNKSKELPVKVVNKTKGVLSPSNLTVEQLEKGLLYDLKDYAEVFIKAEKETGVNAVFLSAVSAFESGWAKSNVSSSKNNLFGWTSNKGYRYFNSKEECILYVATKLKELYLTEGGVYFNGYEVQDINIKYNGSQHWEDSVNDIMSQIQNRIEEDNNVRVND